MPVTLTPEHERRRAELDQIYRTSLDETLAAVAGLDYDARKRRLWELRDEAEKAWRALHAETFPDEDGRVMALSRSHAVVVARKAAEIVNLSRSETVGPLRRQARILMTRGLESAFGNIDR